MTSPNPDPCCVDAEPQALVQALLGMADTVAAGVAVQGAYDRRLRHVNPAFAALFGATPAELTGRCASEWLPPGLDAELAAAEVAALQSLAARHQLHRLGEGLGRRSFRVIRQRLPTTSAQPLLCCIWTELPDEQAALALQLQREIDLARREQREFALLLLELDRPESSAMSSEVLVSDPVGQCLRSSVRAMDSVFRLAPERHAVLLSGAGLATAHARARALRQLCVDAWPGMRLSAGVASCPHTASQGDALVAAAVQALRRAGELGGDRVAVAAIRLEPPT